MPLAMLVGVEAEALPIPRAQGRRVGGPHEGSTDPKQAFHAATLPLNSLGCRSTVRLEGLEPPTSTFVALRSIQLSYRRARRVKFSIAS